MGGMTRRGFIGAGLAAGMAVQGGCAPTRERGLPRTAGNKRPARTLRADVVIIGGGLGGCAAALAALEAGCTVVMTEESAWPGGQATSQAVPPDENRWVETFGATRAYQDYRNRVRGYYRRNYPLTDAARAAKFLNPGNGGVSALCHEPCVSEAVLREMLAPHIAGERLTLLTGHAPLAAETRGDTVAAVAVSGMEDGETVSLEGKLFLDATETGELLPLAGVEHVTGTEARGETGELHAPAQARPGNMQACTWCFAMEHRAGENHVIDRPENYGFWRGRTPKMSPPWSGPLLSLDTIHPVTLKPRSMPFDPTCRTGSGWWTYRRILDRGNFRDGFLKGDVTVVNWPQNDYLDGNPFGGTAGENARHMEGARQLSLSLFYWLQTEAPRPDGGAGWPGLRLRGDLTGTRDGLAMRPYIRESRRIRAEFTVLEGHVGREQRAAETGRGDGVTAAQFPDSAGIGFYRIDLHPSTGGDNYIDIDSMPFQIPLGALIPARVENLLPACKNIGTTHITNGCYRLHPVEWNIGEAAGALAARCVLTGASPRAVRNTPGKLAEFQKDLSRRGVPLAWPEEVRAGRG